MNNIEKLAQILNTSSEALLDAGKADVLDSVISNNDQNVDRVLVDLNLTRVSMAEEVYDALTQKLLEIDKKLFELLGKPDLSQMSSDSSKLLDTVLNAFNPSEGFYIKKEKAVELLAKQPPQSLLEHFGYQNVSELFKKEGFASVVAALRFTQTEEWMHQLFDVAYQDLKPEDFEDRDVEIKVLDTKWLAISEKFMGKKFHNVSHLKEYGVIFISPDPIDKPGETLRLVLLLLHYLHEVPFYSNLFKKFSADDDFISKLQSLLRSDVLAGPIPPGSWRIAQRYLAKSNPADPRLSERHVNPEAEHWYKVSEDFKGVLSELTFWTGLDHVGDFFKNRDGVDTFVSFNVVDLVMSMVTQGETKYTYHQKEALWNYIFSEYMGRDKMNQLIEENIIKGFIEL